MIEHYIEQHGRRLYGLCLTLCAGEQWAEDLYQETWLRAYTRLPQYDSARPFEPWLTGICVNAFRDEQRKRKLSPFFNGFQSNEDKEQALNSQPDSPAEDYSDLHAAIDRLPSKLRTTVILHYFHDLDQIHTAAALGVPVGTVKSRLNQARKLIRKELEHEADIQF